MIAFIISPSSDSLDDTAITEAPSEPLLLDTVKERNTCMPFFWLTTVLATSHSLMLFVCITQSVSCMLAFLSQGLGMIFDFYQQRTKEDAPFVGGWASNFTYDFEIVGATCGLELDYIPGACLFLFACLSSFRRSFSQP